MALHTQVPNGKGEKIRLHEARATEKSHMFPCCPLDLLVGGLEESLNHYATLTYLLNELLKARPSAPQAGAGEPGLRHWTAPREV